MEKIDFRFSTFKFSIYMKRTLVLFILLATTLQIFGATAATAEKALPAKTTHLYAVKGADSLYLDHYAAPVEGVRPCVIFVFGGGFARGVRDKEMDIPHFQFLQRSGYDVVSIDYRLGMRDAKGIGILDFFKLFERTINLAVEDLFTATSYIVEHAEEWNIDPAKIVATGSSAGAITVLQGEHTICNKLPLTQFLPDGFNYAGIISYAGAVFSLDGAPEWNTASAPILLFHGNADNKVPYNKVAILGHGMYGSKYIAGKLKEGGMPYWFYTVEYEDHSMAGKPMFDNHAEILLFLDEFVLKGRPLQRTTFITDLDIPERKTFFLPTDYIGSNY